MTISPWSFLDPIQQSRPLSLHRSYNLTIPLPLRDVTVPVYLVPFTIHAQQFESFDDLLHCIRSRGDLDHVTGGPCCTIAPTYLALQLTVETGYLRRDLSILDVIHCGAWLFYECSHPYGRGALIPMHHSFCFILYPPIPPSSFIMMESTAPDS
ncbi:hypothetical protein OPQ81_011959 [Rhizoctonia solani]|nr:hypothetical protein OPQ81_011959 [Rhizoctonia solani]